MRRALGVESLDELRARYQGLGCSKTAIRVVKSDVAMEHACEIWERCAHALYIAGRGPWSTELARKVAATLLGVKYARIAARKEEITV